MAVMLSKTYNALMEAGASKETAQEAAEEIAAFDSALSEIREGLADVRSEIKVVKWMLAVVLAGVVIPIIRDLIQ